MGAWGVLFDQNDDAADWLNGFEDSPSWQAVRDTLKRVWDVADGYLEAPESCEALAAGEVVAAGLGRPSPSLDANV